MSAQLENKSAFLRSFLEAPFLEPYTQVLIFKQLVYFTNNGIFCGFIAVILFCNVYGLSPIKPSIYPVKQKSL